MKPGGQPAGFFAIDLAISSGEVAFLNATRMGRDLMLDRKRIRGIGALLVFAVAISGCVQSPYGYSAPYPRYEETKIEVALPANAPSISQQFRRSTLDGSAGGVASRHEGLDVIAKQGTPVLAAASGRVVRSYFEPRYGNQIVIDHGVDGRGLRTVTDYKHLNKRLVSAGDVVSRGQQIGELGRTGLLASGILHLHFEIHREIRPHGLLPQDPNRFWANGVGRVTCFDPGLQIDESVFRATYPVVCRGGRAAPSVPHSGGSLAGLQRPDTAN